ncbi:DUF3883 domain-containing protein [Nocardiopsis alba]|uniref:protein NO VEIN domain-containing protein n=1 Tax=Nocardiopsis alba TaxID=53437 RepID=UPI0033C144EC
MYLMVPLDQITAAPVYRGQAPDGLAAYEELVESGYAYVLPVEGEGIRIWPDAYLPCEINEWGAEKLVPLYSKERARSAPAEQHFGFRGPDLVALDMAEEILGTPPRYTVLMAGRTAPCCGRLAELAIIRADGTPLFHKIFAAHNGEQWHEHGLQEFWPCASKHEGGDAPFSHWAEAVHSLLLFWNRDHVVEQPSKAANRTGCKYGRRVVVWGPEILHSVMAELRMAHGQPRNNHTIDVDWCLESLEVLDLQAADLFWHEADRLGVGYLAHMKAKSSLEACAWMLDHARYLAKDPKLGPNEASPQRPPGLQIGPPAPQWRYSPDGLQTAQGQDGRWQSVPSSSGTTASGNSGPTTAPRQADPQKRRAVEEHAEAVATAHYERRGWRVVKLGKPYDLQCTRNGQEKHVEVKGLSGPAETVMLTRNEVDHAQSFPDTELFVVSGIRVSDDYEATGGDTQVYRKWYPDEEDLTPETFRYKLPPL